MARKPKVRQTDLRADEADVFGRETWMVLPLRAVRFELDMLGQFLRTPARPEAPDDIDDDEWMEIIARLALCLGPLLSSGIAKEWKEVSTERDRFALCHRIGQALRALDDADRTVDATGAPTGALLPASFSRRMEHLLGMGELPLAWVRRLNVAAF